MRIWWVLVVGALAACSKVECGEGTVRVDNRCVVAPADGGVFDGAPPSVCSTADECAARTNAVASCEGNACVYSCASGYEDCDAIAENGCEADLASVATCGECTTACTELSPNTVASCEAGGCVYDCGEDWADCDGNPLSGCESSLVNAVNCLGCGMSCPAPGDWCLEGACRSPARRAGFVTDSTLFSGNPQIVALDDGGFILAGAFSGSMLVLGVTHTSPATSQFVMRVEAGGGVRWFEAMYGVRFHAVARDGDEIVFAGGFTGDHSFGRFTIGIAGRGGSDMFVARMSLAGDWVSARAYGGEMGNETPSSVAVTSTGLLLAGTFETEADFGLDVLTADSYEHGFVLALDDALAPVRQLHLAPDGGRIRSITVAASAAGDVAVAGTHEGALTFGSARIERPFNTYVSRWTAELEPVWAQGVPVGGAVDDIGFRSDGDLLVAYRDGGLVGSRVPTPRAYLLRYDRDGALVWARDLNGAIDDMSLAISGDDSAYVVGIASRHDFRTPALGARDGFVMGTAPSGAPTWHRAFYGSRSTWLTAVDVSAIGEVFVAGMFVDTVYDGTAPPLTTPRTVEQTFVRSYTP